MNVKMNLPLLPLRDIVVFPHMVAPLFVGRKQSVNALNTVMSGDKKIFLLSQKNSDIDNPNEKNLYRYGTVAKVLQLLKLPDGTLKVLVEGIYRAKVNKLNFNKDFIVATISEIKNTSKKNSNVKALQKLIVEQFEEYQKIRLLSDLEKESLNILLRAAAVRILCTRVHDYIFHPPNAVVVKKDPFEYLNILKWHQQNDIFE